ncbi:putative 2-phosphosulfolactate phosphatase [bioreactor metagenome]|uniref:2-phosphosulfolactate phosphatase n=1 Tax=bioreactor metagenome TaxID=1076179 RepID=A0A645DEL6_9ZZZZ|nr:2-phosphosulfolactate phosphatase [Petrimonas sp.]
MKIAVDICLSPALYPFYQKENDVVVVVDIFRATTTMCTAFNNGAAAIIPIADIELAKKYKSEGFLVGAERKTRRVEFADFGNSPFEYSQEKVSGREIVFTTTNGTRAIDAAKDCERLLIGAFSNIEILTDKCLQWGERIIILCAGWNNKVNIEDTLFGGAFVKKLSEKTEVALESDAVRIALGLWESAKQSPLDYIKNTDHYRRLIANGVESDAAYCLRQNTVSVVPYYDKEIKKLKVSR